MKIGFLGGGNMASAMAQGLASWSDRPEILICDVNADKRAHLEKTVGAQTFEQVGEWVRELDVLILAVKPQGMQAALAPVVQWLKPETLVLTVAAGIELASYQAWLPQSRIVRAMPNTPALIGLGVTGVYVPTSCTTLQKTLIHAILGAMGAVVEVDSEAQLDQLGTISGCGPAYVFRFMEALTQAAQAIGLDAATSQKLVLETFVGATQLAKVRGLPFSQLREQVTSKGGTTAAALAQINAQNVDAMMQQAVQAALRRTEEMKADFKPTENA